MKSAFIIILFLLNSGHLLMAQETSWSFEVLSGIPYNFRTPLVIRQQNEQTLRLNAKYRSEPFKSPYYYILRMARWENNSSWELEFVHHKIFLDNKPPEIQEFSVSHGYNMILLNRAFKRRLFQKHSYILRLGAGAVLSHPENTVRDKALEQDGGLFGQGYIFTGTVLHIAVGKRFYLGKRFFFGTEIKCNPTVSRVPVRDGFATVWNMPLTFAFGVGMDFITGGERF